MSKYFAGAMGTPSLRMKPYKHGDKVFENTFKGILKFYHGVLEELNDSVMLQRCRADPQHTKFFDFDEEKEMEDGGNRRGGKQVTAKMMHKKFFKLMNEINNAEGEKQFMKVIKKMKGEGFTKDMAMIRKKIHNLA